MAADGKTTIWRNGALVPYAEAQTHVLSHALHYGSGVFEGIRCYATARGPAIFRLREHIDRLFFSAKAYKIAIPFSREDVMDACRAVVATNDLGACYLRPLAFLGHGSLGVYPKDVPTEVIIAAVPWGTYLGPEALDKGIRATVSSWQRLHHAAFPCAAKGSGQYLNSMLAVREAREKGFEEALMLDRNGNVSEGSGENIFVLRNGRLATPGLDSSILAGITRDAVLALAQAMDIPTEVRSIVRAELYGADEIFLTGTAAEVSPVREVDGYVVGSGGRGPLTKRIQEAFFRAVRGEDPSRSGWLTYV